MKQGSAISESRRRGCLLRGITLLTAIVFAWVSSPSAQAEQASAVTLRHLQVAGSEAHVVITLAADGPISGRLQRIAGDPVRFFVDLQNVRSGVDAVTPVNRGGLLRIRAGLNQADPPVTRVVLEVSNEVALRVERGTTDHELRIVAGDDQSAAARTDVTWCVELAERLATLLDRQAPITSQPAQLAEETAWSELERELNAKTLTGSLQAIHFTLVQSARLGRIAATQRRARELDQAAAGYAGARLLLDTARARLAELADKK
jgi:hypothetical protein